MSESAEVYDGTIREGVVRTGPPEKELSPLEQFFANLIVSEVTRQMSLAKEAMSVFKEEVSDLIGTQLDALKAGEVADAVKAAVEIAVSQAVADGKRAANMDSFKEVQKRYNVGLKYGDINELIDLIDETREKILSKRQTLRTVRQSMDNASLAMKEAEANILADITSEVTDTGKPAYSNDKARQAELMVRKGEDDDYLAAAQQYISIRQQAEALEDEVSSLDSDLKTAEMQFHAECKSLEAMTAEMNIYAAALGAGAYSGAVYGAVELAETALEPVRECWCAKVSPAKPEQINQENINTEPKGW